MDESLFYIAGGALIVVALALSLIGMASDGFPSRRMLAAGMVLIALLVGVTAVGAVELTKSEDGEEVEQENTEGSEQAVESDIVNENVGQDMDQTGADGESPTDVVNQEDEESSPGELDGGKVFVDTGCGSCHSLTQLGADAQGTIGPNLNEALAGKDEQFIETSIVDPSAYVEDGYPDGTMPAFYKEQLTDAQITALVTFLKASADPSN